MSEYQNEMKAAFLQIAEGIGRAGRAINVAIVDAFASLPVNEFAALIKSINSLFPIDAPAISYYCIRPVFPPYNAPVSYLDGLVVWSYAPGYVWREWHELYFSEWEKRGTRSLLQNLESKYATMLDETETEEYEGWLE